MPVRVLLFDADGNDTELTLADLPAGSPGARQLLWVDFQGPPEEEWLNALAPWTLGRATLRLLSCPSLTRPSLTHHGQHVTLSVNAALPGQVFAPLTVVAGERFVVTSHPHDIGTLSTFMAQMQGETQLGQLDSAAFLAVLLSRMLETYFEAVNPIEEATDDLDAELLRAAPKQEPLDDLVQLRRQVGVLRRELAAHRPVFMHLASPDFVVFAGDEREAQFTNLLMQFDHALDSVAHTRDLVLGSFDLYMSSLGRRTNDIMRVLTVVTLALGILASVAGLMGMNFEADIFKSGNSGFWEVVLGAGLFSLLLVAAGHWRKWW